MMEKPKGSHFSLEELRRWGESEGGGTRIKKKEGGRQRKKEKGRGMEEKNHSMDSFHSK